MSDDNAASNPSSAAGGFEPSRRGFIYGTAAAAAGVALSKRVRGGTAPLAPPAAAAPGVTEAIAAASGTGWAFVQAGPQLHGTGSLALTMNAASTQGTLLVATVLSTDPNTAFIAPSGWRLAKTVKAAPGGRAEIWYYPGIPPAPGNPGGIGTTANPATFTSSSQADCRGALSEFNMPAGTMPVLDAPGHANGTTGGFTLTAASGNVDGGLGISMAANFFGPMLPVTNGWTGPSGWTKIREIANVSDPWAAWYNLSLTAGAQSLTATYQTTGSTSQMAWGFAFAAFRGARFQALHLDGSEVTTMVALDSTGQELIMGGDVEGLWRTADFGDHWQLSQDGLYGAHWRSIACVAWSKLEPGYVYACVGSNASQGNGGFLVSADGGVSWSMRSTKVQFQGNAAGSPPRPGSEGQDTDRSVGHLLAQDPQPPGSTSHLYAATYIDGVFRSSDAGHNWSNIGLSDGNHYARAIVLNPANTKELFVGTWDWESKHLYGGVWHCPDATNPSFTRLPAFPTGSGLEFGTVADLKIVGGYLYAACPLLGIFRAPVTGGAWTSLNGGPITTGTSGPLWLSLDGYLDSATGDHVIVAACGDGVVLGSNPNHTNVVKITIDSAGNVVRTDLTGTATINIATIPPDDQGFWRATSGYHNWLGGNQFHNAHVLINPNNHSKIYVTGAGGFFRTSNADAQPQSVVWDMAVNGATMAVAHLFVTDPNDPNHVIIAGSDFVQTDLADPTGWDTSKVHSSGGGLGSGNESHAVAFDPSSNVFTGVNTKYGQNAGGAVFWRASGDTTFTWHDTGYPVTNAPMGIFAGSDRSGPFIVVVTQGADVRRAVPGDPTMKQPWNWSASLNTGIGTHGNVGQHCPIAPGNGAGYLYCFDRAQGIFRSADFGNTWTFVWNTVSFGLTVSDPRSGWLAVNPAVNGELWVCTNDPGSPFKVSGAGSGTVGSSQVKAMGGNAFPNGSGGIVFTSAGQPYVVALNGPLPTSDPLTSPQLLTLPVGASTWTDAGGDSVGSYASAPGCVAMTSKGLILIASTEDFGVYGFPIA